MSLKYIAEMKQLREDLYKALEEIANLKARISKIEQAAEVRRPGRPRKEDAAAH